jgi:hypothetical protein
MSATEEGISAEARGPLEELKMHLTALLVLFVGGSLVTYLGLILLKSAERHDAAEDERLWHYLLHPGTL